MATLTPETGAGIAGANTYASIVDADDYHALRANTAWTAATEAQKTAALVQATDYLTAFYRTSSARLVATQGLPFPVLGSTGVPTPVANATLTLALYALTGPLTSPAARGIKAVKSSLDGVVSEETTYDDVAPVDPYPAVTAMLTGVASLYNAERPSGLTMGRLVR